MQAQRPVSSSNAWFVPAALHLTPAHVKNWVMDQQLVDRFGEFSLGFPCFCFTIGNVFAVISY